MSFEALIAELNQNIVALNANLASLRADAPAAPAAEKPARTRTSQPAANSAASTPVAPSKVPPAASSAPVVGDTDYAPVQKKIIEVVSKKGRDVAAKVLGEFGVAKGPDLQPAQYAEAIAKLNAALLA